MQLSARNRTGHEEQNLINAGPYQEPNDEAGGDGPDGQEERSSKLYFRQGASRNSFPSLYLRWLKHRWLLLSTGSKAASALILVLLWQHIILGTWDQFFHRVGEPGIVNVSQEKTFAVAINTFKRPDMLRDAVQHYAEVCGLKAKVSQVFVIWAEQGTPLPDPDSFFTSSTVRGSKSIENRAEVQVLQKTKDSLNSRFEPIEQMRSQAVFMVDDDIRVACPSLLHAFDAWKAHPDSMTGFYPRLASPPRRQQDASKTSELVYHPWPIVYLQHEFNFILTKASFLHSKYLELYTSDQFPQSIKDHVDEHKNCEDIAMSMLVANYTRYKTGKQEVPIYVEGQVSDRGLLGGISTGSGHMATRSDCLTKLTEIFQKQGWEPPLSYKVPLGQHSWIKHSPGFWWQSRPSNSFEWFAFDNTFT